MEKIFTIEHKKKLYSIAESLRNEEKYEDAIVIFEKLGDYSNSKNFYLDCKRRINEQNRKIEEQKAAEEKTERQNRIMPALEAISGLNGGFGKYNWIIIREEDNTVTLLCEDVLAQPDHYTLYGKLGRVYNDILENNFTDKERNYIKEIRLPKKEELEEFGFSTRYFAEVNGYGYVERDNGVSTFLVRPVIEVEYSKELEDVNSPNVDEWKKNAEAVEDAIKNIGDIDISTGTKEKLEYANTEYARLYNEEKCLVSNYEDLIEANNRYNDLYYSYEEVCSRLDIYPSSISVKECEKHIIPTIILEESSNIFLSILTHNTASNLKYNNVKILADDNELVNKTVESIDYMSIAHSRYAYLNCDEMDIAALKTIEPWQKVCIVYSSGSESNSAELSQINIDCIKDILWAYDNLDKFVE